MIKDERQHEITRTQVERFENAVRELESTLEREPLLSKLCKAQLDGLRSQLSELREELQTYERHEYNRNETKYEPRYSGPNKIGICVCGHSWQRHHLSVVMNDEYREATGEGYWPEECEHFGWNEMGGMEYKDGKWIDHCHRYEDAGPKQSPVTPEKKGWQLMQLIGRCGV